jgi:hypothetical protein
VAGAGSRRGRRAAGSGLALLLALSAAAGAGAGEGVPEGAGPLVPRFVEETAAAGLEHRYGGEWEYMVGGGVAVFDCTGDGLPELVLAGGEGAASLWLNRSAEGGTLAFAHAEAGVEATGVTGLYPLDVDGDGITDLALTRVGANLLLQGRGDCRFAPAGDAWGLEGGDDWTAAFAATWEAGADWPTLAFGSYIDRREAAFPWGSCTANRLHRPAAPGERRFAPPVALAPSFCALSMLFTDWDRSGRRDLRIANDREYYKGGREQLWQLPAGGPPREWTEAEGWRRLRIWGMGIASRDITGDGYPEYFLTSMADNKLQRLAVVPPAAPDYDDIAFALGAIAQRPYTGGEVRPSTAWHAQFEDVNNDGRADLFIAKGNVSEMPDFALRDPNNLLLGRADGRFEEAGDRAGVASMETSRGAALADLNADGLIDLVVVNRNAPAQLWRNATAGAGNWLAVALRQEGANRDAVGAWIEVRTAGGVQAREVTVGGGHAGGVLVPWHFGLGPAAAAEVRVIWPDGAAGAWLPATANRTLTVARDR